MLECQQLMSICELAARAGAEQLLAWRGHFATREKSVRDLVTDADLASQKAVFSVIRDHFPDHGLLGEESADLGELARQFCWIVDPLDGTTNYVHGFPCFAVSVAVAQEGHLAAGAILDPLRQECFLVGAGQGSRLNGDPITVSAETELSKSLVAVSFPPESRAESPDIQAFLQVIPRCRAVRRTGSAALNLAYVASGRLDAHWAHRIHPWDSAAGVLLVHEAGGKITASRGGAYQLAAGDYLVAATADLHRALLPLITGQ